jgi:hypothetical protein
MNELAIVGNGRTRVYAPHNNEQYDVWMMNNHALYAEKRLTAMFEMHPDALATDRYRQEYRDYLMQPHPFPIYTHGTMEHVPASQPYPLEQVTRAFGRNIHLGGREITEHFTSSFPYALALALLEGYPRIELYGIDLERGTEYTHHREALFFWLGIASHNGTTIIFPEQSELIQDHLYPFH